MIRLKIFEIILLCSYIFQHLKIKYLRCIILIKKWVIHLQSLQVLLNKTNVLWLRFSSHHTPKVPKQLAKTKCFEKPYLCLHLLAFSTRRMHRRRLRSVYHAQLPVCTACFRPDLPDVHYLSLNDGQRPQSHGATEERVPTSWVAQSTHYLQIKYKFVFLELKNIMDKFVVKQWLEATEPWRYEETIPHMMGFSINTLFTCKLNTLLLFQSSKIL